MWVVWEWWRDTRELLVGTAAAVACAFTTSPTWLVDSHLLHANLVCRLKEFALLLANTKFDFLCNDFRTYIRNNNWMTSWKHWHSAISMPPCRTVKLVSPLALQLIATIAFLNIASVAAIKCYVCQSNIDPKCADPFDNLTLPITDCDAYPRADLVHRNELDVIEEKGFLELFSQPAPVKPLAASMCRKIRQKVDGEWRTIRGCGYLGPPGELPLEKTDSSGHCQMRFGSYDVFMESCTCNNKDGCNGSTSWITLSPVTISLLISASILHSIINNVFVQNQIIYSKS